MIGLTRSVGPALAPVKARATVAATIEPVGRRTKILRDHMVKVAIHFPAAEPADAERGRELLRGAFEGFAPPKGETDKRRFADITVARRVAKTTVSTSAVVGIEASVVWGGRPGEDPVEHLRGALLGGGYRVTVRETRECAELACATAVVVEWNRPAFVPSGWYSNLVCGKHCYRTCAKCKSVFALTSVSAAGQAPSLKCEVCGDVLVAWGTSKVWSAELVTRGAAPRAR